MATPAQECNETTNGQEPVLAESKPGASARTGATRLIAIRGLESNKCAENNMVHPPGITSACLVNICHSSSRLFSNGSLSVNPWESVSGIEHWLCLNSCAIAFAENTDREFGAYLGK